MQKKFMPILIATVVSGYLSGFLLQQSLRAFNSPSPFWGQYVNFGPGVIFGAATAVLLAMLVRPRPWVPVAWVAVSALAWFAAIRTFLQLSGRTPDTTSGQLLTYAAAGLVGAIILSLAFKLLVSSTSWSRVGIAAGAGGLLGVLMTFIMQLGPLADQSMPLAFIVWQLGIALALFGQPQLTPVVAPPTI